VIANVNQTHAQSAEVPRSKLEAAFIRLLERERLGLWLALCAIALSSSCLFIGFYLDDIVGRYIYSDLPGARELFRQYMGGYGLATGVPADNHWQVEAGYAPWWIYDHLRLRMFRPLGMLTHALDAHAWPNSAALMHAQSLFWLALLVLAAARMYRGVLGPRAGGLAAVLFAFDHTHGFEVGYNCNRYALLAAFFGVLSLDQHLRWRMHGERRGALAGPLLYVLALLSGESSISVAGYLLAYAALVEQGSLLQRARTLWPYLAITLAWRLSYNLAGFGANGSGPYVDPVREPVHYLLLLLERGPILLLGQFFAPPAEVHTVLAAQHARTMLIAAVVLLFGLALLLSPLLRRNRLARFWAAGLLFSLVPAACTYPHNRQLLFTSLGALALLAQLWHLFAIELHGSVLSRGLFLSSKLGAVVLAGHLIVSPLVLPLMTCGITFFSPLQRAEASVGDEIAGRDVVFLTAPDYLAVKMVQLTRRVEHRPLARRWRALSFGPQDVVVSRKDDRTLELQYQGGILSTHFMELYRDRRLRMSVGDRIDLQGLAIEVLAVTADGRAERARFAFERPLEAPSLLFYAWRDGAFVRLAPPAVGASMTLPAASLPWSL
jgi:hypothetical protein